MLKEKCRKRYAVSFGAYGFLERTTLPAVFSSSRVETKIKHNKYDALADCRILLFYYRTLSPYFTSLKLCHCCWCEDICIALLQQQHKKM